jgi:hypothetical protein
VPADIGAGGGSSILSHNLRLQFHIFRANSPRHSMLETPYGKWAFERLPLRLPNVEKTVTRVRGRSRCYT